MNSTDHQILVSVVFEMKFKITMKYSRNYLQSSHMYEHMKIYKLSEIKKIILKHLYLFQFYLHDIVVQFNKYNPDIGNLWLGRNRRLD